MAAHSAHPTDGAIAAILSRDIPELFRFLDEKNIGR